MPSVLIIRPPSWSATNHRAGALPIPARRPRAARRRTSDCTPAPRQRSVPRVCVTHSAAHRVTHVSARAPSECKCPVPPTHRHASSERLRSACDACRRSPARLRLGGRPRSGGVAARLASLFVPLCRCRAQRADSSASELHGELQGALRVPHELHIGRALANAEVVRSQGAARLVGGRGLCARKMGGAVCRGTACHQSCRACCMTLGVQNSSRRSESGSSERLRITGRLRIRVVSESIDRSVLGNVSMACQLDHRTVQSVAYQSAYHFAETITRSSIVLTSRTACDMQPDDTMHCTRVTHCVTHDR